MERVIQPVDFNRVNRVDYRCSFDWPDDFYLQCHRNLSFDNQLKNVFEVFTSEGEFIRAFATSLQEAERAAWDYYNEMVKDCPHPMFEKVEDNTDGAGNCKMCGVFKSGVFRPQQTPSYNA